MTASALPLVCTENAHQNGAAHPLLLRANAPLPVTGSGIIWHCWGQGAVLVLLHDWNQTWHEWQHNIEPLSRKFQVCAAQIPCVPGEPFPEWNEMQAWSQALHKDLNQLFPEQPVSLLGEGWGSMLAAYIAPNLEQLSSLVLLGVGGHGRVPHLAAPQPDWLSTQLQGHWQSFFKPALLVWGEKKGVPAPCHATMTLVQGHEEREWMALPHAANPLQQTCATEINMVLAHWLMSHS